jgi:hypothetical protein
VLLLEFSDIFCTNICEKDYVDERASEGCIKESEMARKIQKKNCVELTYDTWNNVVSITYKSNWKEKMKINWQENRKMFFFLAQDQSFDLAK